MFTVSFGGGQRPTKTLLSVKIRTAQYGKQAIIAGLTMPMLLGGTVSKLKPRSWFSMQGADISAKSAVLISRTVRGALVVLALSAALAHADGNVEQKTIGNPGAFWSIWGGAKAHYVAASEIKGGVAQRVEVTPKPRNPWDAGAYGAVTKPVKRGDVIVLTFYARTVIAPENSDLVMVTGSIYEAGGGSTSVTGDKNFVIGKQWKAYCAFGTANRDYAPGTLSAGLKLGTGEQTIDFSPLLILNMGPTATSEICQTVERS